MRCVVNFPATWIDANRFEAALRASCGPHAQGTNEVVFNFPVGCKIMVDGAIRLLSLANQLVFSTRRVQMNFEEGESGTMGYLDRMGFFDQLDSSVETSPRRPLFSAAMLHRGGNSMLVEIARINKDSRDDGLPTRLTEVIGHACSSREDADPSKDVRLANILSMPPTIGWYGLDLSQAGKGKSLEPVRISVSADKKSIIVDQYTRGTVNNRIPPTLVPIAGGTVQFDRKWATSVKCTKLFKQDDED